MANDDPFDYAFGQLPDPNPPGTTTRFGIGPDDPLVDWGRNISPSDLAQYIHDPEGFKQNMINQGQPPPDHHYVATPRGLQAVDPQSGAPVRTDAGGRIQGNLSDYLNPPVGRTAAQAVAPPAAPGGTSRALGFTDPITGVEVPGTPSDADVRAGGGAGGLLNIPPEAPIRQPGQILAPRAPKPAPGSASAAPIGPPEPAPAAGGAPFEPAPPIPVPRPRPVAATPSTPAREKEEKEVKALSSEAMSDFAKSLQGVKMPQRPAWQPMGAPSVRSPVAVHPEIQTLLAAIGQGRPSPQQIALMRLLGRA